MDPKSTNPYTTEIPVEEAEKELAGPSLTLPNSAPAADPAPTATPPVPPTGSTPTPPPPPPPMNSKTSLIPKIIIGVLVILILLLSAYIVTARMGNNKTQKTPTTTHKTPPPTPTDTLPPTATPTPSIATTSANPTSNRFYSQELGIYFDYAKTLPTPPQQALNAVADGTRVYVLPTGTTPANGQYVDVLSKITTDSTLQAVSKVTMSDPNYAGCTFSFKAQTPYPSTYEQIIPTCPNKQSTNLTFFLGDSEHPDKLLFFSIGQTTIPSSSAPQVSWQDTLRFL